MAGSAVTKDDLKMAVSQYAEKNSLTVSENENGFALMPGDIIVSLKDGKPDCGNKTAWLGICDIISESREEPACSPPRRDLPARHANTGKGAGSSNGKQMVGYNMPVRDMQVAELTFEDIKTYICPAASDQETMMFLKLCQARKLNPFLKEAYLIKYDSGKPAQMVVGKDKFTKTAEEHPQFDGYRAGIIVSVGDEIVEREGTFYKKGEELVGGWAEVHRKDRKMPFKQTIPLSEYNLKRANWLSMPGTMIRKVALVQALRECFATDLAGCYDSAEMDQSIDAEYEVGA